MRAEKETTERQQAGGQTSEGTGELWVKSTGMAADGGDFDAARPGAGREADRESFEVLCLARSVLICWWYRSYGTKGHPPRPVMRVVYLTRRTS